MTRLFWILLYTIWSTSISINAFRGLVRYIPINSAISPKIQKYNRIYVPPNITEYDDLMDHGELAWDFEIEDVSDIFAVQNATSDIIVKRQLATLYMQMIHLFICGFPGRLYYDMDLETHRQIMLLLF
jgi:hypothetical protein